LIILQSKL